MKRIVSSIFVITAAVLAAVVLITHEVEPGNRTPGQPKVVTPVISGETKSDVQNNSVPADDGGMTSFIPLASDETLISILTLDFDGDTRDDQINLVRKMTSPYLYLIVGLYNPATGSYERTAEIATQISQVKTFSYTGMDVIGDHRLALVYQGITDSGESIMQIYLANRTGSHFRLMNIGDFKSDGTIFIQQSARNESYELSQSNGVSFPVWVYSTDKSENKDENISGHDQLQTKYEWNSAAQKYVQTDQLRITGKRLAAKELERIQNGNVKTFSEFLSGLWYKTTNEGDGIRYMFFDYENQEIILLYKDAEEVYSWEDSYVNSSGMYLSTENTSISNLQRRYYISLVDIDEIQVRMQDDLRMTIDESNLWNGSYKKMDAKSSFGSETVPVTAKNFIDTLVQGGTWHSPDGSSITFSPDSYTVAGDTANDSGTFAGVDIADTPVITFRSSGGKPFFSSSYTLSYAVIPVPDVKPSQSSKLKNAGPVTDTDTVILKPVELTPEGCLPAEEPMLTITREKEKKAP